MAPLQVWLRRALLLSCAVLLPSPAHAAWPNDASQPVTLVSQPGVQAVTASIADGAGGYFTVWNDKRAGNYDVYAQHVDVSGNLLWGTGGAAVATGAGDQANPEVVLDATGGIIVGWVDASATAAVFAQRLNAAGAPQWGVGGVRVAVQANPQFPFTMCSDGAGGAEFAWDYLFSGPDIDVYAQRLAPAGTRLWGTGGVPVCTPASTSDLSVGVSDAAGGMWIVWRDNRATTHDIFGQRLNASGVAQFATNGINVESFISGDIEDLTAVSDGMGGVIAAFSLHSFGDYDVVATHAYGDGSNQASSFTTEGADQRFPTLAADPAGGFFMFWSNVRLDIRGDVFGAHFTSAGFPSPGWPPGGLVVAGGLDIYQDSPVALADGEGGAIVTWREGNSSIRQIMAQRFDVNANRPPGWQSGGNAVATRAVNNTGQVLAATGNGGVFCTWDVPLSVSDYDLAAQRIDRFGKIGTPEPHIAGVKDVPNDQGGQVRVSWDKSPLDTGLDPTVLGYQVWRQVPVAGAISALRAGTARLLGAGAPHEAAATRVLRAIGAGAQATYWEFIGGVAAQNLAGYSMTASTTGDSIGGSNPRTKFMVEAVSEFYAPGPTASSQYWDSAPDSGYSVDNLPPALPSGFAGTWSGSGASLHWNANTETDLASYRLYRGTNASFVPSPANRIATPTQTWYEDIGAAPAYYRLTAVDIHGNESGSVLLLPTGTAAVDGALPQAMDLVVASANPVRGSLALRLDLPAPAAVRVHVLDAAGHEVARLAEGTLEAGRWPLTWSVRNSGHRVPAGVYFVRLDSGGRAWTRKVMVVP